MSDLSNLVKAYDVRGIVGTQLTPEVARAIGAAFVTVTGADRLVCGRDMRESGPSLLAAFAEGAGRLGADVVDIGLASTDLLYFASGHLNLPAAMFTATPVPSDSPYATMRLGGMPSSRRKASPASASANRPASLGLPGLPP